MNDLAPIVQMIPVNQINVLNPRSRNKVAFQGIVAVWYSTNRLWMYSTASYSLDTGADSR